MKKFFSWFGLVFFVFSLFFVVVSSTEAASCNITGMLKILDGSGKPITSTELGDLSKPVYVQLSASYTVSSGCGFTRASLNDYIKKIYDDPNTRVVGFINRTFIASGRSNMWGVEEVGNDSLLATFLEPKYEVLTLVDKDGSTAKVGSLAPVQSRWTLSLPNNSSKTVLTNTVYLKITGAKSPVETGPKEPDPKPVIPDNSNQTTNPGTTTNTNDGRPDNVSGIGNLGQGCDRLKKQFELVGGEVPEALAAQCGTVGGTINRIINLALGLAGSLAVLFIFLGGIRYLTAAGSETQAKSARGMMQWAALGLVVIVLAFVIVRVVTSLLT